jgi:hypothetical protein
MGYAAIIAALVAYFVAYAVLALGEAVFDYLSDGNQEDGRSPRPGQGQGPGYAPGPR